MSCFFTFQIWFCSVHCGSDSTNRSIPLAVLSLPVPIHKTPLGYAVQLSSFRSSLAPTRLSAIIESYSSAGYPEPVYFARAQTKGFLVLSQTDIKVSSAHLDKSNPPVAKEGEKKRKTKKKKAKRVGLRGVSTHGENSPSLWPTMSSVMVTSLYTLPLYTWNLRPTKLGRMVAARACVLIGFIFSPGFGRVMGRLRDDEATSESRSWILYIYIGLVFWTGGKGNPLTSPSSLA